MSFQIEPKYTLGVIGAGNLGGAVLTALVASRDDQNSAENSGCPKPDTFLASVNSKESAERLREQFGEKVKVIVGNNEELVKASKVVLLACKPYAVQSILSSVAQSTWTGRLVISLVAGLSIKTLAQHTGGQLRIARAMTNTACKVRAGVTAVSLSGHSESTASGATLLDPCAKVIQYLFSQTGKVVFIEESKQDVATALCGSATAFTYLFMEALADGAVRMGLPYAMARECAQQVVYGASKLVEASDYHPEPLRQATCTPQGTTIGGLLVLEDRGVRAAVARAVEEATNIAAGVGKKN